MKKVLITLLSLGTLSANAGGYVNGGLGFGMHKSEDIKPKGLMLTLGGGYSHDLQNNMFVGGGLDLGMSMAKKKFDSYDTKGELKLGMFADVYAMFGYKMDDKMSAYAKLGFGMQKVKLKETDTITDFEADVSENLKGLVFGLGMNYMVDAKGAVYAELLMKNQKKDELKVKTMPALVVGYRYFF
jgi:hypothetical protein